MNFTCFWERNIFVLLLWICSGESVTVLLLTTTNIDNEMILCFAQVWGFQLTFLRLLIRRNGEKEKIEVPKLVNLSNRREEKFETVISSPCKRKFQQDQEKITKTNKIKSETKTTSKNKDTKKSF